MAFSTAAIEAIRMKDVLFFCDKTKVRVARRIVSELSGEKISSRCLLKCKDASKQTEECKCFRCLCRQHCKLFLRVRRRKPHSTSIDLDTAQWESLKTFVESNMQTLSALSLEQGVEFIKSKISTNQSQVNGLPSRLHFWKRQD